MSCKVGLFFAWGLRNPGDHALTVAALRLLTQLVDPTDIVVVSRYRKPFEDDPVETLRESNPDVSFEHCWYGTERGKPIDLVMEALMGLFAALGLLLPRGLAVAHLKRLPGLASLSQMDTVIINGGNLFQWNSSRRSFKRYVGLLLPVLYAKKLRKKVIYLPQTAGPFEGSIGRYVARLAFDGTTVFTRDASTHKLLQGFGFADMTLIPTVDVVLLAGSDLEHERPEGSTGKIGLVARATRLGDQRDANGAYLPFKEEMVIDSMLSLIRGLEGRECYSIAQTLADESVSEKLAAKAKEAGLGDRVSYKRFMSIDEATSFYAGLDLLVTMRFHAGIFSLNAGTPAVMVYLTEFGAKAPGMYAQLGLDDWALDLEASESEALPQTCERLLEDLSTARDRFMRSLEAERARCLAEFRKALAHD